MVSCISNVQLPQITLVFYLITIPFVASLSFNFTHFITNDRNITYEGSADPANNVIQLTINQRGSTEASVGRATYSTPMQLWDKASNNLTDFVTSFTFVINTENRSWYGDGLAFFLAPARSSMPDNVTGGGIGLAHDDEQLNSTNPFVAIEFDIFPNAWDPRPEHVGIDINSVKSVVTRDWVSATSIREGLRHEALISYDSGSRNLSVVFTNYYVNRTYVRQQLSYVVDLREILPELVTFGFSGATGAGFALHSIYSWNFSSTLEVNRTNQTSFPTPNSGGSNNGTDPEIVSSTLEVDQINPTSSPPPNSGDSNNGAGPGIGWPTSSPTSNSRGSNNRTDPEIVTSGLVIGLVIGSVVLAAVLGLLILACWRKRHRRMLGDQDNTSFDERISSDFERGTWPKKFSYNELARVTNNFSEDEKLGQGGFGSVYKGFLREKDSYVAVKRVSGDSQQGIKEYTSEVKIISRLRHRNLVQLLGWCHERKELLLVYEFMPNGSLDFHLFKGKTSLSWTIRFKIAQGLASALIYLHEEWEQCVVHRDIKSSNVMLDSNFNAKLGDFGLARLVDHEKGSQTTVVAGTMGYMAPEYVITSRASKETDVYSFGVVALEIACGRKPIDPNAEVDRVNLVEWVWSLYGTGNLLEAADPKLCSNYNAQEIEHLITVGLWCANPDSNLRPSIRQAILVLNSEAPLPTLSLRMPVPTYFNPIGNMHSAQYGTSTSGTAGTDLPVNRTML